MVELLLCSLFTIVPDYLYRRFVQHKRIGQEINFFSVWYELRWGISGCVILTVLLVTLIFYYHPATTHVTSFFRTVTILTETGAGGRVTEVYFRNNDDVKAGDLLFRIDSRTQEAAVDEALGRLSEIEAAKDVAQAELIVAQAGIEQAEAAYKQADEERDRMVTLQRRGSSAVSKAQVDRAVNLADARQGELNGARANVTALQTKLDRLLPAQQQTAEAALERAYSELQKTEIRALVDGRLEQFALQPGDYVNPILRPAGILVPTNLTAQRFQAGFGQLTGQVVKPGMVAEIACATKPFTIIPMVVVGVQDVIAGGALRPTDQLIDIQDRARPGTITVFMEPLYPGQADGIPPGSRCIANAYTNFGDELAKGDLGLGTTLFYHTVDTVGLIHALLLRVKAMALPVVTLVFGEH